MHTVGERTVHWARRPRVFIASVALALGILGFSASAARACTCSGPTFWEAQSRAETIVLGRVSGHIDRSTSEYVRADFVLDVQAVLSGQWPHSTAMFHGAAHGDTWSCNVRARSFPVGSEWLFIIDGTPTVNACSGRYLEVLDGQVEAPGGAIALSEATRRIGLRRAPQVLSTTTPTGADCDATFKTWMQCNAPRIKKHLESIEPWERRTTIEPVRLTGGHSAGGGLFLGWVSDLGPGVHVYVFGRRNRQWAYAWAEAGADPLPWPCVDSPWNKKAPAGFPREPVCTGFIGSAARFEVIKPGHEVARCECVPPDWVARLLE